MQPNTPQQPATTPPAQPTEPKIESPQTTVQPATLQTADDTAQFSSLKPEKDIWRIVWKAVIALNFIVAGVFLLFVALKIAGIAEGFQAGAAGTPFWLLPELVVGELVLAIVYYVMKRPELHEVTSKLVWLGIGLGAAFLAAIAYVIYVSV